MSPMQHQASQSFASGTVAVTTLGVGFLRYIAESAPKIDYRTSSTTTLVLDTEISRRKRYLGYTIRKQPPVMKGSHHNHTSKIIRKIQLQGTQEVGYRYEKQDVRCV